MESGHRGPDEITALQNELKLTRHERVQTQRRVADGAGLDLAIERVRRDRSAQSSPAVDEARERAQKLHDELDESWDEVDRIRVMVGRLTRRGAHLADLTALSAALEAEAVGRAEIRENLEQAGVLVRVPSPSTKGT